jgi:hypothetical protein
MKPMLVSLALLGLNFIIRDVSAAESGRSSSLFPGHMSSKNNNNNPMCSRRLSRQVNKFLHEQVLPLLFGSNNDGADHMANLPEECMLNTKSHMYYYQELNKSVGYDTHNCGYCKKKFVSEYYLDRHMDNKHGDKIPTDSYHCLADLAPIFGIPSNAGVETSSSVSDRDVYVASFGTFGDKCDVNVIEKLGYKCTALARSCFKENDEKMALMTIFVETICNKLQCQSGSISVCIY